MSKARKMDLSMTLRTLDQIWWDELLAQLSRRYSSHSSWLLAG